MREDRNVQVNVGTDRPVKRTTSLKKCHQAEQLVNTTQKHQLLQQSKKVLALNLHSSITPPAPATISTTPTPNFSTLVTTTTSPPPTSGSPVNSLL